MSHPVLPDHEAASRHPRHPRPWLVRADAGWLVIGCGVSRPASSQLTRGPVWHHWHSAGHGPGWKWPAHLWSSVHWHLTSGPWWPAWGGLATLWAGLTSDVTPDEVLHLINVVNLSDRGALPWCEGGGKWDGVRAETGLPWCHSNTRVRGVGVHWVWSCENLSLSSKACLSSVPHTLTHKVFIPNMYCDPY